MRVAAEAEKQGYSSQASIGSAEERLAGQYQGRQADAAVTDEIGKALTPPAARADGQPAPTAASRFQGAQDIPGGAGVRTMEQPASATRPPIPEAPAAPGASQPPENPVTGSATPQTGDAATRLGQRKINPLTGKPIGYDPRTPAGSFDEQFADSVGATSETAPQGSAEDESGFLDGVSRLTTPEGGDLTRKAAVEEMNRLRRAAGQTPADVDKSLNALLGRDRAASQERARINTLRITDRPPAAQSQAAPATPAPNRQQPIRLPLTRPPIQGPQTPFASPLYRSRLLPEPKPAVDLVDLREKQATELKRQIKIPEWQKGTILGKLNRRVRESLIDAGRAGNPQR